MKNLIKYIKEKLVVNRDYNSGASDSEVLKVFNDNVVTSLARDTYFADNYQSTWKKYFTRALWVDIRNDYLRDTNVSPCDNRVKDMLDNLIEFDTIYRFLLNMKARANGIDDLLNAAKEQMKPEYIRIHDLVINLYKFNDIVIVEVINTHDGEGEVFIGINQNSITK